MAVRSGDDRQVRHRLRQRLALARCAILAGITIPPIPWPMIVTSVRHNTVLPFFCNLPHHSMLPVVPGPPSLPTAAIRRPRNPQPVDSETEHQGKIRNIEFKVLMYTQLAVINNQRLCDFETVELKNGPHIHKCQSAECMACIWEAKIIRYSGNPGIRGGFTTQNPVFSTWLHLRLTILIDIHTPLIIPNQVPVDVRYGETINLDSLPICRPNNCDLRAVCGALQKLLPQNHPAHKNEHANYRKYESIGGVH